MKRLLISAAVLLLAVSARAGNWKGYLIAKHQIRDHLDKSNIDDLYAYLGSKGVDTNKVGILKNQEKVLFVVQEAEYLDNTNTFRKVTRELWKGPNVDASWVTQCYTNGAWNNPLLEARADRYDRLWESKVDMVQFIIDGDFTRVN